MTTQTQPCGVHACTGSVLNTSWREGTITKTKLKEAITKYPHRCNMLVYVFRANPTMLRNQTVTVNLNDPADDTVFCRGPSGRGWTLFLAGHQPYFNEHGWYIFEVDIHPTTTGLLGISDQTGDLLFNYGGWPNHLRQQLDAASQARDQPLYAATMCAAIDFFIPTDRQLVSQACPGRIDSP